MHPSTIAEILPIAHHTAEPGPPNETVIELARVVDRGIRESGTVDMSKLVIKKDVSVVGVFADNSVVDHDGNLFDACSYASTCAILSSKMPKWEMVDDRPKIVEGAEGPTPVQTIPVSITMARIKDHILVDPNGDEWESILDARVTISTNSDENICAMQKGGTGGFTQKQLEDPCTSSVCSACGSYHALKRKLFLVRSSAHLLVVCVYIHQYRLFASTDILIRVCANCHAGIH